MFQRNQLQASNPARFMRVKGHFGSYREFLEDNPASYPTVPSMWPNRATRRAIKQGHEHRLSQPWRVALGVQLGLRQAIKAL